MLRDKLLLFGQRWIESHPWYLAPLSWLYGFIVFLRNKLYDWALLPITKVRPIVVSVGNIVAGGTGKTPFVHLLAASFAHRNVAILSRGFGSVPDEAMLLAKKLPNVKVYVGKDRVRLAQQAEVDLIILDDGFQHRRLHRDFDIVLTREKKEHYLPFGFLRDNPSRLRNADAIFSIGKEMELSVKRILDLQGNEIPSIQGWKVAIFSGIANPKNFKKTVESLGAEVVFEKIFADHAHIDLDKLPRERPLVCTEKDAIKLLNSSRQIYYLEMEMVFINSSDRWEKLVEKIDQKIDNRPTYER